MTVGGQHASAMALPRREGGTLGEGSKVGARVSDGELLARVTSRLAFAQGEKKRLGEQLAGMRRDVEDAAREAEAAMARKNAEVARLRGEVRQLRGSWVPGDKVANVYALRRFGAVLQAWVRFARRARVLRERSEGWERRKALGRTRRAVEAWRAEVAAAGLRGAVEAARVGAATTERALEGAEAGRRAMAEQTARFREQAEASAGELDKERREREAALARARAAEADAKAARAEAEAARA